MTNTIIDYGASNSSRFRQFVGPALWAADGGFAFWRKRERADTSPRSSAIAIGPVSDVGSNYVNVSCGDVNSLATVAFANSAAVSGVLTGPYLDDFVSAGTEPWYLVVVQRNGANLEIWAVAKGGTATTATDSVAHGFGATGLSAGLNWNLGVRDDSERWHNNPLGEFFVFSGALTNTQITALAVGVFPSTVITGGDLLRYYPFRTDSASEVDVTGNGPAASRSGTGWALVTGPFDTGGSTPTITSPTPSGTIGSASTANIGCTTTNGVAGSPNKLYVVRATTNIFTGVTAAQVKAGQNAAGNTTGVTATNGDVSTTTPVVAQSGLAANTLYYYAIAQEDAGGLSNVLTGSFTTAVATRSCSFNLDASAGVPLAVNIVAWTHTAIGGAAVDGVPGTGIALTVGADGLFSMTGLSIAAGAGFVQFKVNGDNNNVHTIPVTFA